MYPKPKTRNILVTGCGSIGQRHIRNLLSLGAGRIIAHDISEDRLREVRSRYGVEASFSWQEALQREIDVVFVCNPTSLHVSSALDALAAGSDVFIEKPLSHNAEGLDRLFIEASRRQRLVFIACNFRFDSGMRKAYELIRQQRLGRVFSVSAEFGHFLPDWRPQQDYRQSYSSHVSLGGGILLDAYHEFDYLGWLFGSVERVFCQSHKASSLEIDTEDLALVTLRFSSGVYGQISLDYLRRPYRRSFQIIGELGTLEWDFGRHSLRFFDSREAVWTTQITDSPVEVNQMYLDEMKHFLACREGDEEPIGTLQDAVNVLSVIMAAKQSSQSGAAVEVFAAQAGRQSPPILPPAAKVNLAPSIKDRLKIGAIIQARMGSRRLPGKSLVPIADKPVLGHVIDRVRMSRYIEEIVVATTTAPADSIIEDFARNYGVKVFRGQPDDVLDRYYQAATQFGFAVVVRLGADDPLKDAREVDRVIGKLLEAPNQLDYVSNWLKPSYPEGMDTEAFSFETLERAWREAKLPSEREHVTPYIWMHPEIFRLANVEHSKDLSRLRWTLDTPADLEFMRQVYADLYHGTPFSMQEVLELLSRRPELQTINGDIPRHAGFRATQDADHSSAKSQGLP